MLEGFTLKLKVGSEQGTQSAAVPMVRKLTGGVHHPPVDKVGLIALRSRASQSQKAVSQREAPPGRSQEQRTIPSLCQPTQCHPAVWPRVDKHLSKLSYLHVLSSKLPLLPWDGRHHNCPCLWQVSSQRTVAFYLFPTRKTSPLHAVSADERSCCKL